MRKKHPWAGYGGIFSHLPKFSVFLSCVSEKITVRDSAVKILNEINPTLYPSWGNQFYISSVITLNFNPRLDVPQIESNP